MPPVPLGVRLGGDDGPRRATTPLGTVDSPVLGEVDPAGRVQPAGRRWSFDWWVGCEDRWHHPSMEANRSHGPHGASPVRETTLRVPGGDIVQRVGGLVATAGDFSGPTISVEIENRSAVPVALALVLTAWELDGPGSLAEVSLDDPGGTVVSVDGVPAVLLDRPASRAVACSRGEAAKALAAGEDNEVAPGAEWTAATGSDLEVALVVPLAHTATVRLLITGPDRKGRTAPTSPWTAPPLESVASGWGTHGEHDPRIVAPYDAWGDFVSWSAPMLRIAGPAEVTDSLDPAAAPPAGQSWGPRLGSICEALAGIDSADATNAVAGALVRAQRFSGRVEPADGSDATAALLWSAGAMLVGPDGAGLADDFVGPVAKAVRHLDKRTRKSGHADAGGVGPRRCAAALRHVAVGLAAVGQPEVAADALALAQRLDLDATGEGALQPVTGAGTGTFGDARSERDAGWSGDASGLKHLAERVQPRRTAGVADAEPSTATSGFDVAELAETRLALLDALVADTQQGPAILAVFPDAWAGQGVEAHGVRTAWGQVSFALRWHGSRPALLWEVTPSVPGAETTRTAPVVSAPGVDPAFSATQWSGEALLVQPLPAEEPTASDAPGEGQSFT